MRITPREELENRYRKIQSQMEAADLEAVLILQNADLFYFTGSIQQGVLYIPVNGEPIYMVRKEQQRARMECGLNHIRITSYNVCYTKLLRVFRFSPRRTGRYQGLQDPLPPLHRAGAGVLQRYP